MVLLRYEIILHLCQFDYWYDITIGDNVVIETCVFLIKVFLLIV